MRFRNPGKCRFVLAFLTGCLATLVVEAALPIEVAGAKVELADYQGSATFTAGSPEKFKLAIDVVPHGEREPLTLRVELANTGRETWPFQDVEVRDSAGRAIPVRRAGIEWHRLFLTVPADTATYIVQAVDPPGGRPSVFSEKDRHASDSATGLHAAICDWPGGRKAALSIRFDDSHRTHLSKAIPILREYGFRGTFMVNPGTYPAGSRRHSAFQEQRSEWEAIARRGDQEFANHTAHHRGADNDEDMEREVGEASEAIWQLFPDKSKLLALNLGGGTWWTTTRTLSYYLDKYMLFDASSGSLGMDDVYGNRVAAFRQQLERHIKRGGWCRIHYHSIGDGEAASEANFRDALDVAKEHESELWVAGMADIHKYGLERAGATLAMEDLNADRVILRLTCATDAELYDQALTLEIALPVEWASEEIVVTDAAGERVPTQRLTPPDGAVLRLNVPPVTGRFVFSR